MAASPAPRLYEAPRVENPLEIVAPEGVPLSLEIAPVGERLTAFLMDALLIGVLLTGLVILNGLVPSRELETLIILVFFLVRNFYFMFFEQRWQGATPGKRRRHLQVIDAGGGQLSIEAVIVRNLTRDVEIFLPLTVLVAPQILWPDAPIWALPVAGVWALALGLVPLLNKQHRRIGDLVAGTVVIAAPQVALLGDMAASEATSTPRPDQREPVFTKAQLSVYGIYELQVLEKILRGSGYDDTERQMADVRKNICRKIGWKDPVSDDHVFLKAFYAAQRAHLEGRMLMGERREDKFGGTGPAAQDDQEE